MRWWSLLLLAGCRQILGIDDPHLVDATPTTNDAGIDARAFSDAPCADDDRDGVCNSVDDWPCGVKPVAPANLELQLNAGLTDLQISATSIAGQGPLAVLDTAAPVRIQFNYKFADTACQNNCQDQIQVGFAPDDLRSGCVFDQQVPKVSGATGVINNTAFTAPVPPGVYELRVAIGQALTCSGTAWYNNAAPPMANTIAKICVR